MLDANNYKNSHLTLHSLSTHHGLCLGIVWTNKIWCVIFLETNSTTKLVIFVILKNAPCSKLMSSKLLCLQTSAKVRVPTTFAWMVSTLWLSHQSTFGRLVTPAALNTWEGFANLPPIVPDSPIGQIHTHTISPASGISFQEDHQSSQCVHRS